MDVAGEGAGGADAGQFEAVGGRIAGGGAWDGGGGGGSGRRRLEPLPEQLPLLRQVAQLRFGAPDLVQQVREQVGLQRRHAVVPQRHGAPLRYIKQ